MSEIRIDPQKSFDWLRLELGKANAVGPEFLESLGQALDRLDPPVFEGPARPVVVTGTGSAFSAGLDLVTLLGYDRDQMTAFLARFDDVFGRFACLDRPTIAAVNGHAVAGGAVLLLACDWRIGASEIPSKQKPYVIGLKESAIGLPLPRVVTRIVRAALGSSSSLLEIVLTGDLFSPKDALERGMLHRVVSSGELEEMATAEAERFAQSTGRAAMYLKREFKQKLYIGRTQAAEDSLFLDAWFADETQRRIRAVVESLGR